MQIRTLIGQILRYVPGVIVPAVMQFVAIIVFTRLVDPDAYGRYVLVVSTAHIVDAVCLNWIRVGQLRFYEAENQKNELDRFLATMYITFIITGACIIPISIILLLILPLDPALSTAVFAGVGYLLLRAAVLQSLMRYRSAGRATRYTIMEISRSLLGFAAAVALVLSIENKELGLLIGILLGYGIVWAADLRQNLRYFAPRQFDISKLREIFLYLWPVIIQMSLIQLMIVMDRYMIGFFLGTKDVGLYSVSFNIAKHSIGLIFAAIMVAAYPLLLKEFESNGIEWARGQIKRNASIVLAVCLPATAGLAITSGYVAAVMLGKEYQAVATEIIPWIALSTFVTGLRLHVYAHVFQLFKRVDLTLKIMALVVATNFVLNAILIPRMGITGAILATVIADALGLILYILVGRRLMPLELPLRDAWRTLMATAVMSAGIIFLDVPKTALGLTVLVLSGVLIYLVAALLFDVLGARAHLLAHGSGWLRTRPPS